MISTDFRAIPGYEGRYDATENGQIYSRMRRKFLASGTRGDGSKYLRVHLLKAAKVRVHTVHSLVAAAFIGPRPNGHVINHLDGDPTNNSVSNIVYCTQRENAHHALHVLKRKNFGRDWMRQIWLEWRAKIEAGSV